MIQALQNIVSCYPGMPEDFYLKLITKNIKDVSPQVYIELGRLIGKREATETKSVIINQITDLCQRQN